MKLEAGFLVCQPFTVSEKMGEMRRLCKAVATGVVALFWISAAVGADPGSLPEWAYPMNSPGAAPPAADDGVPRRLSGSDRIYTLTQIRDLYAVPDWFPAEHPPMPRIVANGRKPAVFACGYCHLPNGLGRPENAGLAGQPAVYLQQQMEDFQSGRRGTALPDRVPPKLMIANSKAVAAEEVREAAAYFSSLPAKRWVRVVEADEAPKAVVSVWALVPTGTGTEPLGQRIVELPEDRARFELRDSTAGFVAYVPKGSTERGRSLMEKGVGGVPCTTCHGTDLRGLGPVPALAGRSPMYIARQLYEFQHGIRAGEWSGLMAPQVAGLTQDDIIAIAAYAASLEP